MSTATKPLRSDAAANRERILASAWEAFAEHGREACVEDIARRAGVGVGTIYRRFPTKAALAEEIAQDLIEHLHTVAGTVVAEHPAGEAFEAYVLELCGLRSRYGRALGWLYGLEAVADRMAELKPVMRRMIDAGKAAGRLRDDLDENDLALLMWSVQGVVEETRELAPDVWRRQVEIVFAGWRPVVGAPLLTPPIGEEQVVLIRKRQSA